ncbi:recombinase family protein [Candidatus Wolfebacteria bacterium]|nr:recombinase family protein [Candidatus Wolfebacteria bacterium]
MKYIVYARKSTEEDDRQVLNIEAQLVELKEFAAKEKLEIVASLCEAKTAKEPDKNIGSNHVLENRQFVFAPKIQYELVAERSEATASGLQFPFWCSREDLNL